MDRIRDIRPPGSPHDAFPNAERLVQRLLANTAAGPNACVIWTGRTDHNNYGVRKVDGRHSKIHRVLFQLLVGPVSNEAVVDHQCHNRDTACPGDNTCLHRRCVNPHHLDVTTQKENQLRSIHTLGGKNVRKTHCPQGHPYDAENTRHKYGRRYCRECGRIRCRAYKRRTAAASRGL